MQEELHKQARENQTFATEEFKQEELRKLTKTVIAYHIAHDLVVTKGSFIKAINKALYELAHNLNGLSFFSEEWEFKDES